MEKGPNGGSSTAYSNQIQQLNRPLSNITRAWIGPYPEMHSRCDKKFDHTAATPYSATSRLFRPWPTGQSYLGYNEHSSEKITPELSTGTRKSFWTRYNNCETAAASFGVPKTLDYLDVDVESAFSANSQKPFILEEMEAKIDFGPDSPPSQHKKIKMVFSSDEKMREFKNKLEKQLATRKNMKAASSKNYIKASSDKKGPATARRTSSSIKCAVWMAIILALAAVSILLAQFLGALQYPFVGSRDEIIEVNVCGVFTPLDLEFFKSRDDVWRAGNTWSQFKHYEASICNEITNKNNDILNCKLEKIDSTSQAAVLRITIDVLGLKKTQKTLTSMASHESVSRFLTKSMLAKNYGNFRIKNVEVRDPLNPKTIKFEMKIYLNGECDEICVDEKNAETLLPSGEHICRMLIGRLKGLFDPLHCQCHAVVQALNNQIWAHVTSEIVEDKYLESTSNGKISNESWCSVPQQLLTQMLLGVGSKSVVNLVACDSGCSKAKASTLELNSQDFKQNISSAELEKIVPVSQPNKSNNFQSDVSDIKQKLEGKSFLNPIEEEVIRKSFADQFNEVLESQSVDKNKEKTTGKDPTNKNSELFNPVRSKASGKDPTTKDDELLGPLPSEASSNDFNNRNQNIAMRPRASFFPQDSPAHDEIKVSNKEGDELLRPLPSEASSSDFNNRDQNIAMRPRASFFPQDSPAHVDINVSNKEGDELLRHLSSEAFLDNIKNRDQNITMRPRASFLPQDSPAHDDNKISNKDSIKDYLPDQTGITKDTASKLSAEEELRAEVQQQLFLPVDVVTKSRFQANFTSHQNNEITKSSVLIDKKDSTDAILLNPLKDSSTMKLEYNTSSVEPISLELNVETNNDSSHATSTLSSDLDSVDELEEGSGENVDLEKYKDYFHQETDEDDVDGWK